MDTPKVFSQKGSKVPAGQASSTAGTCFANVSIDGLPLHGAMS